MDRAGAQQPSPRLFRLGIGLPGSVAAGHLATCGRPGRPVVGQCVVRVGVVSGGADVDGRVDELGDVVQQPVVDVDGDVVAGGDRQGGVDADGGLGADAVAGPAHAEPLDVQHAGGGTDGGLSGVQHLGLHSVQRVRVAPGPDERAARTRTDGQPAQCPQQDSNLRHTV